MDKDFAEYNEKAEILKVLAHPVRLCIVRGLMERGTCNVSNMQHCLEIPQSTLSQHIQKLKAARIIEGRRNGLEINYRICSPLVIKLMEVLF
ncbi:MAG TPA: transcriptional regulator [Clostridium sp.]|jgi:ArsR family transcriptional regulator|uniref:ArsR/SmtB family transcription factor n=1 Tax=Clostridium lapidicellarium TaxID=3240931 RepID=A0ABV4DZJ0_9CLOT|nr:metalloregulator ArsR/SmtB family transcription factor [uncultured Clostridium sp.]NLU09066.1 helix-turn-helix transcriptional regulator [Clostridiales bacterium]HBC96666.1 transcriptional regulator [Clostridium sp.]